jgi:ABC-2 type transport system permease protein
MSTPSTVMSPPPNAVSLTSALRGEWAKMRTLRSTWWSLAATLTLSVLLAVVATAAEVGQWADKTPAQRAAFDATSKALVGVLFAAVILGVLAVRSVSGEHSTGIIRTT